MVLAEAGPQREIETAIINRGNHPIEIHTIQSSCSCTDATIGTTKLAPGQTTYLRARIRIGNSSEQKRTAVRLLTDDEHQPTLPISFSWKPVLPIQAVPESVAVHNIRPAEKKHVRIEITGNDFVLCRDCVLNVLPHPSSVSFNEASADTIRFDSHDIDSTRRGSNLITAFELQILGGPEALTDHVSLSLAVRCKDKNRALLTIPLTWTILPVIAVAPSRLSLGLRSAGEIVAARIALTTGSEDSFKILALEKEGSSAIERVEFDKDLRKTHVVNISLRMPNRLGPWREVVYFSTDRVDAKRVGVPISALIR